MFLAFSRQTRVAVIDQILKHLHCFRCHSLFADVGAYRIHNDRLYLLQLDDRILAKSLLPASGIEHVQRIGH